MSGWTVESVAGELLRTERDRQDREPFTDEWKDFDVAAGYAVQDRVIAAKVAAGQRVIGLKLGLTSAAKQQRMEISSPLTGWLTDGMLLAGAEPVPLARLIHPRIEPEIVFVLGQRLAGPGVTRADALAAVATVQAGFEVIDSRYRNFRFALPDVVADNASSARFYVAERALDPSELDLAAENCNLEVDGEVVDSAAGAAVQGHPAEALALAANALGERGVTLEPGWTVLTGGMTDAVFLHPGTRVRADFDHLGPLTVAAS